MAAPVCALLRLQHEELVGPGFGTPNFALAARELPYVRVAIGQREGLEFLRIGIEAQDRIRAQSLTQTESVSST